MLILCDFNIAECVNFLDDLDIKNSVTNFIDRILDLILSIYRCTVLSNDPMGAVDPYHPPLLISFNCVFK